VLLVQDLVVVVVAVVAAVVAVVAVEEPVVLYI
jgi:hypothetical protein